LPPLAVAAKTSQDNQASATAQVADGEETKDYPPSKQWRGVVPQEVVVAREDLQVTAGPSPTSDAEAQADAGRATEHDISVDPAETIFDVSLEDRITASACTARSARRSDAERAAETDLLFEEDDLQRLLAEVESAAAPRKPTDPQVTGADSETVDEVGAADARAADKGQGPGFLGFLKRKKKPQASPPATSPPPDDNDDPLNKFLSDT
jgi:hypothetical protein